MVYFTKLYLAYIYSVSPSVSESGGQSEIHRKHGYSEESTAA